MSRASHSWIGIPLIYDVGGGNLAVNILQLSFSEWLPKANSTHRGNARIVIRFPPLTYISAKVCFTSESMFAHFFFLVSEMCVLAMDTDIESTISSTIAGV